MGVFAARKGVTMVNQMAASRCMGLIRALEMRLKERPSNRLKCICHNCWEQLIQCRPQKGNHKPKEGGGERKDGCHLKQANFFSKESNQGHVLYQLGGVCMVCVCVGERIRDELALINKPPVLLVACNNYLFCCISILEGQFDHIMFFKTENSPVLSYCMPWIHLKWDNWNSHDLSSQHPPWKSFNEK